MSANRKVDVSDAAPVEAMEDDEQLMRLWLKAGRGAAIFCAWCAFVIPVILTIQMRF